MSYKIKKTLRTSQKQMNKAVVIDEVCGYLQEMLDREIEARNNYQARVNESYEDAVNSDCNAYVDDGFEVSERWDIDETLRHACRAECIEKLMESICKL